MQGVGRDNTVNGGGGDDGIFGSGPTFASDCAGVSLSPVGNRITGGAGNDRIEAGLGNDAIDGGDGNDTIYGWCGDDTINSVDGIAGNDTVARCGAGEDTVRRDFQAGPTPRFDKVLSPFGVPDCEHIINVPV
jgi:Ca2+-binding RTX toxin-like protein